MPLFCQEKSGLRLLEKLNYLISTQLSISYLGPPPWNESYLGPPPWNEPLERPLERIIEDDARGRISDIMTSYES